MVKILKPRNRWSKKKGLSIAEVVVSLVIVFIVSAAVTAISVYTSNSLYTRRIRNYFEREIDNISMIYLRYKGENGQDFIAAIHAYNGQTVPYEDCNLYYDGGFSYLSEEDDYEFKLAFDFDTSSLTLRASKKNNELITERSVAR